MLSDLTVVVNLAVGGKNECVIGIGQGLGARLYLVCERALDSAECTVEDRDLPTPTILRRSWQRTTQICQPKTPIDVLKANRLTCVVRDDAAACKQTTQSAQQLFVSLYSTHRINWLKTYSNRGHGVGS